MPSLTRRRLLAGSTAAATGGIGVDQLLRASPFDSWTPAPDAWPTSRRGPKRTAAAPEANPPDSTPAMAWKLTMDAVNTVVVADSTAFIGTDSHVVAVALDDGSELWRTDVPGEKLCYRSGSLYCTDSTGSLAAVNGKTGDQRWTVPANDRRDTYDVLVANATVFLGQNGSLVARDPDSGSFRWRIDVGGSDGAVYLAVAEGILFVGGPGPFETYRPRTGWDAVLRDTPRLAVHSFWDVAQIDYPVVGRDRVYVGSSAHKGQEASAWAFTKDGVNRQWSSRSGQSFGSPTLTDGIGIARMAVGNDGRGRQLVGVDLAEGAVVWSNQRDVPVTEPVVAGPLAVVGDTRGSVTALDPKTGDTVWETTVGNGITSIVPTNENLLVVDDRGTLRCLR